MIGACIFMMRSDEDGLNHTKQLLNVLLIVYIFFRVLSPCLHIASKLVFCTIFAVKTYILSDLT